MLLRVVGSALLITLVLLGVQTYRYESYKSRVEKAQVAAERAAREKEEGWREGIAKWVTDYVNEKEEREKELSATITLLRAGGLRVKPRLSCPSPASGRGDGEAPSGLSREDAEFLLREAARADEVTKQLELMQKYAEELQR